MKAILKIILVTDSLQIKQTKFENYFLLEKRMDLFSRRSSM